MNASPPPWWAMRSRRPTAPPLRMTSARAAFCTATLILVSLSSVAAQYAPLDYPQWRGLRRDGSASGFVGPAQWPDQLRRRWRVDVGDGYATPIIVGRVVYAFTRINDRETLTALDAASGKQIWQTSYAAPYEMGAPSAVHGAGPKATPLFHNHKIFTLGISGIFTAFEAATGKLLWQIPAPAEHPYYGASVSPIGDGSVVFVHPGNYGPLTAFDADTGKVKWKFDGDNGAFASPIIVEIEGTKQIVSMMDHVVAGLALKDGALLWSHPWGRSLHITPLFHRGLIVVSGMNMGVAALRPHQVEGKWTVGVAWETKDVSMFLSNGVVIGDALFALSHRNSGQFFSLDLETGKTLWVGPPREATNTAVVKAGGYLFLLNDDGELVVARSNRTRFEQVKRYIVADSATWAQPAISGDRIFVKDVSSLALWTIH